MNKKEVCATKIAYVRMTEEDLADLDCQVRRVGAASRSAYIRGLVKGIRPAAVPPADYTALMNELSILKNRMDLIASTAAQQQKNINPTEYYTLSSLTALTLQKMPPLRRLASHLRMHLSPPPAWITGMEPFFIRSALRQAAQNTNTLWMPSLE